MSRRICEEGSFRLPLSKANLTIPDERFIGLGKVFVRFSRFLGILGGPGLPAEGRAGHFRQELPFETEVFVVNVGYLVPDCVFPVRSLAFLDGLQSVVIFSKFLGRLRELEGSHFEGELLGAEVGAV